MALDATIGSATANSFVTEAEATAYFDDSLQSASWTGVSSKDAALVSATRYIEMLRPYDGVYLVAGVDVPNDVKMATYELALYLDSNIDAFNQADLTTRIKVAVIEIEQEVAEFGAYSSLPLRVKNLLSPYLNGDESYSGGAIKLDLQ